MTNARRKSFSYPVALAKATSLARLARSPSDSARPGAELRTAASPPLAYDSILCGLTQTERTAARQS